MGRCVLCLKANLSLIYSLQNFALLVFIVTIFNHQI